MSTTAACHAKKGKWWRLSLTSWIFIGIIIGLLFGYLAPPEWSVALKPVGKLFIRLIKMIVAPLIFSTLVVGLAGTSPGQTGRLLLKSLLWFWPATILALLIGLFTANTLRPGLGASGNLAHNITSTAATATTAIPTATNHKNIFEQIVPESIFSALAENSILQIVFFAVLFGMGLASLGPTKGKPIVDFMKAVSEVMFKVTEYVMVFAPIGVGAAIATAIGTHGTHVLWNLGKLVGSLYLALIIFVIAMLIIIKLLMKINLRLFFLEIKEALLLAFSTTSSEAALPKAIQSMERLGVPPSIVGFVIPTGYTFNLDGTTLYLSLSSLFIAQAAGIELSTNQQVNMMLMLIITSKGVAGVPRASLVVLAATCASFGLPVEWIAVILGVDGIMDMARTTVNVFGNCLASVVVAKWEGVLPNSAPVVNGIRSK